MAFYMNLLKEESPETDDWCIPLPGKIGNRTYQTKVLSRRKYSNAVKIYRLKEICYKCGQDVQFYWNVNGKEWCMCRGCTTLAGMIRDENFWVPTKRRWIWVSRREQAEN